MRSKHGSNIQLLRILVILTALHSTKASQQSINTTTTTTTAPDLTTTEFFTTLEVNQCFIGSKCSHTDRCCPSDIDEGSNGVSCSLTKYKSAKHHPHGRGTQKNVKHGGGKHGGGKRKLLHGKKSKKHNKKYKICCINAGFVGCTFDKDCCSNSKCYDGVCQSENGKSACDMGSTCSKTADCCGKHAECIDGICSKTKYKKYSAWNAMFASAKKDESALEQMNINSHGTTLPVFMLLAAFFVCVIIVCATCLLYLYTKEEECDELSTAHVPSIADWQSIRSELPLKPIKEVSIEDDEESDEDYKPNQLLFCFCGDPKNYRDFE